MANKIMVSKVLKKFQIMSWNICDDNMTMFQALQQCFEWANHQGLCGEKVTDLQVEISTDPQDGQIWLVCTVHKDHGSIEPQPMAPGFITNEEWVNKINCPKKK